MSNQPTTTDDPAGADDHRAELSKARLVGAALEVGAGVVVFATIVCGLVWLFLVSKGPLPPTEDFIGAVVLVLAGFAVGLLLWGASEIVRKLDALNEGAAGQAEAQATAVRQSQPMRSEALASLVPLLQEIRDISLMNEQQRAVRLESQGKVLSERLVAEVPALLREHRWVEARRRVQNARERFPNMSPWAALEQKIEHVRSEVESHDVEAATRQVNDLASLGAWGRATDVIRDLLHRHPGSKQANALAERAAAERSQAEVEERGKLMARAQEATRRRDWIESLSLANSLIEKFPRSTEAEAIRGQLPTLQTNAEIQIRQRWEQEYRMLVEQHRYGEALRVARDLIARYPESPQARAMRQQIPRLEQRSQAGATA